MHNNLLLFEHYNITKCVSQGTEDYNTGHTQKQLSKQVQEFFKIYSWPKNIKELKHLLEHVATTSTENLISIDDLRRVNENVRMLQHDEDTTLENLLTRAEKQTIQKIFNPKFKG